MKITPVAAAAALFLSLGSAALADTAPAPATANAATVRPGICNVVGLGDMKVERKPVIAMPAISVVVKASGTPVFGPDLSNALSPNQVDAAWQQWNDRTFAVDHSG